MITEIHCGHNHLSLYFLYIQFKNDETVNLNKIIISSKNLYNHAIQLYIFLDNVFLRYLGLIFSPFVSLTLACKQKEGEGDYADNDKENLLLLANPVHSQGKSFTKQEERIGKVFIQPRETTKGEIRILERNSCKSYDFNSLFMLVLSYPTYLSHAVFIATVKNSFSPFQA